MNPIVVYAKISMSFLNLYRRRRGSGGRYTVAIAFAMSGILIVNVWSIVLIVSMIDRGWLAERRRIGPAEFSALLSGLLLAEWLFVNFVQAKATSDLRFAERVNAANPSIAIGYAVGSAALLVATTIVHIVFS
jgi:hypothetical protein